MHCQSSSTRSADRPQGCQRLGDCHRKLQAQPATTATNGKTTITCRTPALYFTNRVTQKTARTAAAGATVVHRRGRERSTHSPMRQSKRKGSGVFTATATRKKYHHPPFFSFPADMPAKESYSAPRHWLGPSARREPAARDLSAPGCELSCVRVLENAGKTAPTQERAAYFL